MKNQMRVTANEQVVGDDNPLPVKIIGAGSAVSIADGADVAQGATTDTAATTDTGTFSIVALIKRGLQSLTALLAKDFSTQTPSAAILAKIIAAPATEAKQDTGNTSLASIVTQTLLSKGTGVMDGNTLRVTLATDGPTVAALTTLAAAVAALGAPAATAMTVQGKAYVGTATVTRAANTTTYAANDVVGGALTIANAGPSAGDIFLTGLALMQNISAVPSGQTSFRLYLYNATPPSAIADNSPFTLGSGDRASFLGYVDIGTPTLLGTGTGSPQTQIDNVNKQLRLVGGTSLFAYLVTNGALIPVANSETYTLTASTVAV